MSIFPPTGALLSGGSPWVQALARQIWKGPHLEEESLPPVLGHTDPKAPELEAEDYGNSFWKAASPSACSPALGPGPEQKLFLLCLSSSLLRVCLVSSPVKHKCFHDAAYSAISEVNTFCYRSQLPWYLHIMSRGHWAQKNWEVGMHRDSSSKSQGIILKKRRGDNVGINFKYIDLISTLMIREKCKCVFGKVL